MVNTREENAKRMLTALEKAESFIAGFEGDETQGDMSVLFEIRYAIASAKGAA